MRHNGAEGSIPAIHFTDRPDTGADTGEKIMAPKRQEVIDRQTQVGRPTSILARLGLTTEEVTALERQGFVSAESRRTEVYCLQTAISHRWSAAGTVCGYRSGIG